jgi:hypothetical protein
MPPRGLVQTGVDEKQKLSETRAAGQETQLASKNFKLLEKFQMKNIRNF